MNRRGFIGSLLGLAARAALPVKAVEFINRTAALPDAEFVAAANTDSDIIKLLEARIAAAHKMMMEQMDRDLYEGFQ